MVPSDRLVGDPLELRPVVGPGQRDLPLLEHVVEQGLRVDALRIVRHRLPAWRRPRPMWCRRLLCRRMITPELPMRSWRTR